MKQKLKALFMGIYTLLLAHFTHAQVTTVPASPTSADQEITIIYDATQGASALQGASKVYMHAGAVVAGANSTAWTNVVGNWGRDDGIGQMTSLGGDKWSIKITPRTYFNVPAGQKIFRIGMVFRSADGTREGKASGNRDIFVDFGLRVSFTAPANRPYYPKANEKFTVSATATASAELTLFINDVSVKQTTGTSIDYEVTASSVGGRTVKVVAKTASDEAAESFRYIVNPTQVVEALPAGIQDGINYGADGTSVTLCLFAPSKQFVYVLGDFNNWTEVSSGFMKKTPDGNRYWLQITGLTPKKEYAYQYLVDGSIYIADPYAEKILDHDDDQFIEAVTFPGLMSYPVGLDKLKHRNLSVLQTAQDPYVWKINNFKRPEKTDMVVYELLIRDFRPEHSYKSVMDSLSYLKRLGVNVLQLMPVNEFEGNSSWGYNPSFYFAADKYYGTKNDLKALIDRAHELGIAVVIDMVLNHSFGESPMVQLYWDGGQPAANSPWFNQIPKHPFNVGLDFNHEQQATKDFVKRVNEFWLREYKVDGFRFDLSKGFTQNNSFPSNIAEWNKYDATRVATWKRIADEIWSVSSDAYVILEHLAENQEEKELAEYKQGMMFWGNMNEQYSHAARGLPSNNSFSGTFYGARGWNKPGLISYMESHDEERLMYNVVTKGESSGSYNTRDLKTALERMKQAAAFYFLSPGPKMIWQFGEVGYDFSINRCEDGSINTECRLSRKPIRWDYYTNADRRSLYNTYAALTQLKQRDVFRSTDVTFTQEVGGLYKRMYIRHSSMNVLVLGNFNVVDGEFQNPFPTAGVWYDYFSGDSINVVRTSEPITLKPGQFHIFTTRRLPRPQAGLVSFTIPAKVLAREDETFGSSITVYPNPSAGKIKISMEQQSRHALEIKVTDLLGRTVSSTQAARGSRQVELDLHRQPAGVYFVEIIDGDIKATKRIVKSE